MKRVIALLLCLLLVAALLAGCGSKAAKTNKFDEKNIVLQFGAVSDIHIGRSGSGIETDKWAIDAYKMLRDLAAQYSADGLSAMLVSGDLTDNGTDVFTDSVEGLKRAMEKKISEETPTLDSLVDVLRKKREEN